MSLMKAAVYRNYGPPEVLSIEQIPRPETRPGEILVKVHAATVNRTDNATVKAIPFVARLMTGFFTPKYPIPGSEFAGTVEGVGSETSRFRTGDRVFGFVDIGLGAQAEYLVVPEDHSVSIPDGFDFAEAAVCGEGFHYARNFVNKVHIEPGMKLMVYGASGAIGSALLQLLKSMDVWVTAVCSTRHMELMRELGADEVIDYTTGDFRKEGARYDYVLDAVGKISFFKSWRLIKRGGAFISSDLGFLGQNIYLPMLTPLLKPIIGKRTYFPFPVDIPASLKLVQELMSRGQYRAVIDREFPLDEIVEAYRYVEKGKKTGNVVIQIGS